MANIFSHINFCNGKLSTTKAVLLLDVPLEDQKHNLFEDILQVSYTSKDLIYVLDIGWHFEDFEVSKDSFFAVKVIVNEDWSNLLYDKKTSSVIELKNLMEAAISLITKQLAQV